MITANYLLDYSHTDETLQLLGNTRARLHKLTHSLALLVTMQLIMSMSLIFFAAAAHSSTCEPFYTCQCLYRHVLEPFPLHITRFLQLLTN